MKTKKVPDIFTGYHHEIEVLWRFFRKHGNRVTSQCFDNAFPNLRYKRLGGVIIRRGMKCRFRTLDGPNFGYQSHFGISLPITPWSLYLDILQNLMRYNITTVKGSKAKNNLVYSFLRKPKMNLGG